MEVRCRAVLFTLALALTAGAAGAGSPTITHEGRVYVELSRAAETLKASLDAAADRPQARLRSGDHVVTLARNWARILVDGTAVSLDAPVVVRKGVWLVPESFVTQVSPRLRTAATVAAVTPGTVTTPVSYTHLTLPTIYSV